MYFFLTKSTQNSRKNNGYSPFRLMRASPFHALLPIPEILRRVGQAPLQIFQVIDNSLHRMARRFFRPTHTLYIGFKYIHQSFLVSVLAFIFFLLTIVLLLLPAFYCIPAFGLQFGNKNYLIP